MWCMCWCCCCFCFTRLNWQTYIFNGYHDKNRWQKPRKSWLHNGALISTNGWHYVVQSNFRHINLIELFGRDFRSKTFCFTETHWCIFAWVALHMVNGNGYTWKIPKVQIQKVLKYSLQCPSTYLHRWCALLVFCGDSIYRLYKILVYFVWPDYTWENYDLLRPPPP